MQSWNCHRMARVAAILVMGLALLTLGGWLSGLTLLASVRRSYIPMAPTTAIGFLLLGLGLWGHLRSPSRRWGSTGLAVLVLLLAVAKLTELSTGWRAGMDAWFVPDPTLFGSVLTGRMSPVTAASFVVASCGLLCLSQPRGEHLGGALGVLTSLIGGSVLLGYMYGSPLLYGGNVIPVALSTAMAFSLYGLALTLAAGRTSWPLRALLGKSAQALLLRTFVPAIVLVTLLDGWVRSVALAHWKINPAALSAVSALTFAVLITWVISAVAQKVGGQIDTAEKAREAAQAELLALNGELETRVSTRTLELREKNSQMAEELAMARELQISLLPQHFPSVPTGVSPGESALHFLSFYYPTSEVSGDFFSVFPLGENAVGIFICDVMGHGVRAALITSMIRTMVEEQTTQALEPGEMLARVNRRLVSILKQSGTTMFATGFYLVIDVVSGQLRYANAGHPSPLLFSKPDSAARMLSCNGSTGPAMGLFPDAIFGTSYGSTVAGDLILLFTDGFFEVEDSSGNVLSEQNLIAAAGRHTRLPPQEMIDQMIEEIRNASPKKAFDDDVCVVGVHVQRLESALAFKSPAKI